MAPQQYVATASSGKRASSGGSVGPWHRAALRI